MNALAFSFDLNSKISLYIPSTVDVDKPTDNRRFVAWVMGKFSEMFGGATSTQAVGAWTTESGDLVTENVTIVYAFCTTEQATANMGAVVEIAETLKNDMGQEAVTLEYNGQVAFI